MKDALEVKNISVTMEGHQILQDVSFHVKRGEITGLIGPNGAGKTTLLRAVLGLIKFQSGSSFLDGKDLSDLSLKERAKKISYLAQGSPVHWALTAEYMVSLGLIAGHDPWQKMAKKDHDAVRAAMEITDSLHLAGRITNSLSGGEKSCVMLARAIVSGAPYLFADEPAASLDPYHQLQVMDILTDLKQKNHGILIILHDLALAQRYCDNIILLHEGKVAAAGTADSVLSDKNLSRSYCIHAARWQENGDNFLIPHKRLKEKLTHPLNDSSS